jgi:S-adenosylmethionine synthetase
MNQVEIILPIMGQVVKDMDAVVHIKCTLVTHPDGQQVRGIRECRLMRHLGQPQRKMLLPSGCFTVRTPMGLTGATGQRIVDLIECSMPVGRGYENIGLPPD